MIFEVKPLDFTIPNNNPHHFFLIEDNWNDWWEFKTMYTLYFVDKECAIRNLGSVKIGQYNMDENQKRPALPDKFNELDDQKFFSLGQDVTYYEALNEFGEDQRHNILLALNDMALLQETYEKASKEKVTRNSLLRSVSTASVFGQYRRLANGNAQLTPFQFTYIGPHIKNSKRLSLLFDVQPKSNPPSNIHVLIGRNAVGKTYTINNMIESLISKNPSSTKVGYFTSASNEINDKEIFSNVVSVSFSAFDPAEPLPERRNKIEGIPYSYIGLKQIKKQNQSKSLPPKSPNKLKYEFANSLAAIKSSNKTNRWLRAVEMLSADPIFKASDVPSILYTEEEQDLVDASSKEQTQNEQVLQEDTLLKSRAQKFFHRLSSGHKIVLLTLTRLVETVEERTLVFLDEPEAHLHPPLLSAFIRALSDLLVRRNAVAITATHSPVILQEVPRNCVWKLQRQGIHVTHSRTETETFGENIGALTREIFELEVTYSGFYKMLRDVVYESENYEDVIQHFNNELGREAKAMIRALLSVTKKEKGD